MSSIKTPTKKKHFYIIYDGERVGESWAVSANKAITNWWWKNIKSGDEFTTRTYAPSDFDAIEAI